MKKGNLRVNTNNIFPIIKKFLYTEYDIFLRELVSNSVDATLKLKTLVNKGIINIELGDLTIYINIDQNNKTISIIDRGIGMNIKQIDKYINDIAFSSAQNFINKYKKDDIIGNFGLGFYSSFIVSDNVEIISKSYKKVDKAIHWICNNNTE